MSRYSQAGTNRLIDLSHTLAPGIPLFGAQAPAPVIRPWMSHQQAAESGRYEGCTCEITEVNFLTSLGTYLDSPFHFDPKGRPIDALDLVQLILPGIVVDCTGCQPGQPIGPEVLQDLAFAGKAVLFRTDWSRYWGDAETYRRFPYLTGPTALALRAGGARLAGVDFLVIDSVADPKRPVHVTLLKSNILIVENLANLSSLPSEGFTFFAVPVKVAGAAAFPVRAFAMLNQDDR